MKRIPLSFLWITAFSIVSLCPLFAQFAGGTGTEADPWQIATAEQLNSVRNYLGPQHEYKHFLVVNNINLGVPPWNVDNGWDPIGNNSPSYNPDDYFYGSIDGGNNTILGLYIDRASEDNVGLFSSVRNASIRNLKLIDLQINGHDVVGSFAGRALGNSIFENLTSSGVVIGNNGVGGISGYSLQGSEISNCDNNANITGNIGIAGIVGSGSMTVNCINTGNVNGYMYVSGISGQGNVDRCQNTGYIAGSSYVGGITGNHRYSYSISNSHNSGYVTGSGQYIGGLVGTSELASAIVTSFNSGCVTGGSMTGGLVGLLSESTLEESYNIGEVIGYQYVGGAVGYVISESTIINCYSIGRVMGGGWTGGLVGVNDNGEVNNSYWNFETSGLFNSAAGQGRFTYQMLSAGTDNTYIDWDFFGIWDANPGYPYLRFWSEGITSIPTSAEYISPINAAQSLTPSVTLKWSSSLTLGDDNRQTGFKLSIGTDNPPTNIHNQLDIGSRFYYDLANLPVSSEIYWMITPYNTIGDALDCPVHVFQTYHPYLSYPNGNELWVSGTTRTIRWQTENAPPEVKLYISFDNGNQWSLITAVSGDKGYYHIQVPVVNSTSCKIKVAASYNESHYDISDNTFTISSSSSHPKTVVTYPSASNTYFGVGQSVNITWTRQNVSNVALDYSIDDGLSWIEIATGLNSNSYAWITPDNPAVQCRVRVRSVINSDVYDISNNGFSISKIQILSPNGGEIITGDYSGFLKYPISWSAPGVTGVKIEYSSNGGVNWSTVIASTSANSGSFLWSVPGGQTIYGIIRISNAEYAQIYDTSDNSFSIRNPIELLNANGGGFVTNNSLFNIRWRILDVNPSNSICWEYSTNNSEWTRINSNPVSISSESMYWYVNTGIFNSMWLRAIEGSTNRILCKSQSSFRVTDKILMIYEPIGGESYSAQSTQTISWEGEGLTNLNLFYTIDDGVSWQPIVYNVPSSEFIYNWTIPDTPSQTCRVKLQDASLSYMNLESDSNFAITPMQVIIPSAVQGVQIAISGLDAVISWNPVTEDVNGSPIVPDQYIVMYSQSPYANPEDYMILTNTTGLLATHADVALNMSSMFYIVVAVKFDRSNQIDVLGDLASRPGRMAWKELKGKLNK